MLRWIEMYSVSSHSKKILATILPHHQCAKLHIKVETIIGVEKQNQSIDFIEKINVEE